MTYRLIVKPSAEKDIKGLPRQMQRRILERIAEIILAPRGAGSVKLAGSVAAFRVRVGDWRIVYEIDDKNHTVYVTIVSHRREVYRGI